MVSPRLSTAERPAAIAVLRPECTPANDDLVAEAVRQQRRQSRAVQLELQAYAQRSSTTSAPGAASATGCSAAAEGLAGITDADFTLTGEHSDRLTVDDIRHHRQSYELRFRGEIAMERWDDEYAADAFHWWGTRLTVYLAHGVLNIWRESRGAFDGMEVGSTKTHTTTDVVAHYGPMLCPADAAARSASPSASFAGAAGACTAVGAGQLSSSVALPPPLPRWTADTGDEEPPLDPAVVAGLSTSGVVVLPTYVRNERRKSSRHSQSDRLAHSGLAQSDHLARSRRQSANPPVGASALSGCLASEDGAAIAASTGNAVLDPSCSQSGRGAEKAEKAAGDCVSRAVGSRQAGRLSFEMNESKTTAGSSNATGALISPTRHRGEAAPTGPTSASPAPAAGRLRTLELELEQSPADDWRECRSASSVSLSATGAGESGGQAAGPLGGGWRRGGGALSVSSAGDHGDDDGVNSEADAVMPRGPGIAPRRDSSSRREE